MKRILQVIGQLGRGGDTTVVLNVLHNADPSEYHFDFLTHDKADMEMTERLINQGHTVYKLAGDLRKLGYREYSKTVYNILKNAGQPYDIIHTHTSMQSGVVLKAAEKAGIPSRICHSHTNAIQRGTGKLQKALITPYLRRMCLDNATKLVSCSKMAGEFLFGDRSYELIYNGIDTDMFRDVSEEDVKRIRNELGADDRMILIGHVANFGAMKNQSYILKIAERLHDRKDIRFVFVGRGNLFEEIKEKARPLGEKVIFTGQRSDVNVLMKAFDMLILPSLPGEGFPVTIVEAQASGLPCLISDNVTNETEIGLGLVKQIPLSRPDSWEKAFRELSRQDNYKKRKEYGDMVKAAGFGEKEFAEKWLSLYDRP